MNVKDQGPGGLLMLFASSAALYHMADLNHKFSALTRAGGEFAQPHGAWVVGTFLVALAFLALSLVKWAGLRNLAAFVLGGALLCGLFGVHAIVLYRDAASVLGQPTASRDHGRYADRLLAEDYAAAVRMWQGTNPYAGASGGLTGAVVPLDAIADPAAGPAPAPAPTPPIALPAHQGPPVTGPCVRPAGAFLVWVPLVALDPDQQVDPRWVSMGLLLMTCLLLGVGLGRQFFALPLLLVLALPGYLDQVLEGRTHFAWLLFAAMSWVVSPQRYLAALLAGLACTLDPAAWFVSLFLVTVTAREKDVSTALLQLLVVLAVFGAVNGYWIYEHPDDWMAAQGQGLVRTERAADSVGLVLLEDLQLVTQLDRTGPAAYWLLTAIVLLLLLVCYALFPASLYALGPALGVLPFWAFFRSPAALFELMPLLALAGWTSARIFPPEVRFAEPARPAPAVRYGR